MSVSLKNPRGFSLIELLVVISIISTLASVVISSVSTSKERSRVAAGQAAGASINHAYSSDAAGIWDFDESSGNATDMSANNDTAVLYNAPTRVVGIQNNAIQFDGVSQYARTTTAVNVGSTWTLVAWVNPSSASMSGLKIFMSFGLPYVSILNGKFYLSWSDGTQRSLSETTVHTSDKWYFVAATHSGNSTVLFVDGKEVARDSTYASLAVNNFFYMASHSSGYYFGGVLDSVRIYTQSLLGSDIKKMYLAEAGKFIALR